MAALPFKLSRNALLFCFAISVAFNMAFYAVSNTLLPTLIDNRLGRSGEPNQTFCSQFTTTVNLDDALRTAAASDESHETVASRWEALTKLMLCLAPEEADPLSSELIGLKGQPYDECAQPTSGRELVWLPSRCLREFVYGVRISENNPFFSARAVLDQGLGGIMYGYTGPRRILDGEEEYQATYRKGLDALDRIVYPHVVAITEDEQIFLPRFLLQAINNPFQWGMFLVGWLCIALLSCRWFKARRLDSGSARSADELLRRSAGGSALTDTLAEWIPTLGFIGTVVGMMLAMASIGGVISAEKGPELYIAMAKVTANFSLAFNTTFVGLILAMPIALLRRLVLRAELEAIDSRQTQSTAQLAGGDGSS